MHLERRRKRSNFSGLALSYWFSAIARRTQLFGLVLADSAGFLVASNLRGPEAEELSAIAPLIARPDYNPPGEVPMSVRDMHVDRTKLFLAAVGRSERAVSALDLAESGVMRILMTH